MKMEDIFIRYGISVNDLPRPTKYGEYYFLCLICRDRYNPNGRQEHDIKIMCANKHEPTLYTIFYHPKNKSEGQTLVFDFR
jgi:hypothetical protein